MQPSEIKHCIQICQPETHIMPQQFPVGAVILVPQSPAFRLREASLPLARCFAALGSWLRLRGGTISASNALMMVGTRWFHGSCGVSLVLMQTTGQPRLGAKVAPSIWAPWRRWQHFIAIRLIPALVSAVSLLKGTAVVHQALCRDTLQERASSIGRGGVSWRAEPLLLCPRALRLGQTGVSTHPSKLGFALDDAPFQRWVITLWQNPRRQSMWKVWQRIPHFSFLQILCQFAKKAIRFSIESLISMLIKHCSSSMCWNTKNYNYQMHKSFNFFFEI